MYGTKGNIEDVGAEEKTVCYKERKGVQTRIVMPDEGYLPCRFVDPSWTIS